MDVHVPTMPELIGGVLSADKARSAMTPPSLPIGPAIASATSAGRHSQVPVPMLDHA